MTNDLTPDTTTDADATVRALLRIAGVTSPGDADIAAVVDVYPQYRSGIELLHRLPAARYESPAMTFAARGSLTDGAEA